MSYYSFGYSLGKHNTNSNTLIAGEIFKKKLKKKLINWNSREHALTKQNRSKCLEHAGQNECLTQCQDFSSNWRSKRICNVVRTNAKCKNKSNDETDDNHPYLIVLESDVSKHIRMTEYANQSAQHDVAPDAKSKFERWEV